MVDMFQQPMSTYEGWGMDPAYMTPSYMANFRPAYNNPGGNNPYAANPSIRSDIWTGIGPGSIPFGADPLQYSGAAKSRLSNVPADAAMTALQSVAIPVAAWYGAHRLLGTTGIASRVGSTAAATGMRGGLGALGWGMSKIPGMGALGGVPGASMAGGAAAQGLIRGAGALGGFAGGIALPLAAGTAAAGVADSLFIDPYVSTRQGMDASRAQMANQFVGGQGGDVTGSFGMSATRAFDISSRLTEAGAESFAFDTQDFNRFADMGMSAGLFSEIGNMDPDTIVNSTKNMMKTIQTLSAIAGGMSDPEMIQVLSRLKAGGIDDFQKMDEVVKQLGAASAISGTSITQIMDTVGNQGAMMAQQQGIRGVTGMLASSDAYAGFTNARRSGLVSGAQMAALGGVEGMTQSVLQGSMSVMDNPYGRMTMMSGGEFGQDITRSIQGWSERFTQDPLASIGDWELNQGAYKDQALNEMGSDGLILSTLQSKARLMNLDANDPNILASIARSEGISNEALRSALIANEEKTNPASRLRAANARDASAIRERGAELHQEGLGLTGVPILGDIQRFYKDVTTSTAAATADIGSAPAGVSAQLSDSWERLTASSLGIKLPEELTARVEGPNEAVTYTLQGQSTTASSQAGIFGGANITRNSTAWNPQIGALMKIANNGSPEMRKKALRIMELLRAGEDRTQAGADEVEQLITELDSETESSILGVSNTVDREDQAAIFAKRAYLGNEIVANEDTSTSDARLLQGLKRETGTSLSIDEFSSLMGNIYSTGGDASRLEEFFTGANFGDSQGEVMRVLGLESDAPLSDQVRAAKRIAEQDTGDLSGDSLREQLLLRAGGDSSIVDQIFRNQTESSLESELNDSWWKDRNTGQLLNEKVRDAKATSPGDPDSIKNAGIEGIDTSAIKDIGRNLEDGFRNVNWEGNIMSNTAALNKLTEKLNSAGFNAPTGFTPRTQRIN